MKKTEVNFYDLTVNIPNLESADFDPEKVMGDVFFYQDEKQKVIDFKFSGRALVANREARKIGFNLSPEVETCLRALNWKLRERHMIFKKRKGKYQLLIGAEGDKYRYKISHINHEGIVECVANFRFYDHAEIALAAMAAQSKTLDLDTADFMPSLQEVVYQDCEEAGV